jgi:hypothetical protein
VQTIVTSAEAAFRAQRNFIAMASTSKKPGDQVYSCIHLDTELYHTIFVPVFLCRLGGTKLII